MPKIVRFKSSEIAVKEVKDDAFITAYSKGDLSRPYGIVVRTERGGLNVITPKGDYQFSKEKEVLTLEELITKYDTWEFHTK